MEHETLPPPRRTGRPRDTDLTRRLLDGAVSVVAERGYARLNAEVLAATTGAGKAAIYRRWPTMAVLLAEALGGLRLVSTPPDTGSLRGDLVALLRPFTREPSREERAVAAVLGLAHHTPELRECLQQVVVAPLEEAVGVVCDRYADRGHPVPDLQRRLLLRMLQALWWERCSTVSDPASPAELADLVDRVLVPAVQVP